MSGTSNGVPIFDANAIPVYSKALWQWDNTGAYPVATGYGLPGAYTPTKTGLLPQDLQNFVGVPLQYYQPVPTPVPPQTILNWIRYAEDEVEQATSILLCPTWIASPPLLQPGTPALTGVVPSSGGGNQILGQDYDRADAGYDFYTTNFKDSGWGCQPLRYRPIRNVTQPSRILATQDFTGVKNLSFIYPLLEQFFRVPPSWIVEDQDFGLIRMVPSSNVAILPLFALQLSMLGFSENLPQGLWLQYTAGIMPNDYNTAWRFIQQLVLCIAAIQALSSIQGTINLGVLKHTTLIDGVSFSAEYDKAGPFAGLIQQFTKQKDDLMHQAISKVAGPTIVTL